MKYLTVPRLQKLSAMMTAVDVGDRIVYARVEAYSCKLAGADKRAAKEITNAVESELTAQQQQLSPHSMPAASMASITPLGDLREPATRQLLVSLITTLNASYPDYDFSALRAEEFEREPSAQAVINAANVRCSARMAFKRENEAQQCQEFAARVLISSRWLVCVCARVLFVRICS
jgi:hypothetical protein